MVKKQQKKKAKAKKITQVKKVVQKKKVPQVKKAIKKSTTKKVPIKKNQKKEKIVKRAIQKKNKKVEKKIVAKPLKKKSVPKVPEKKVKVIKEKVMLKRQPKIQPEKKPNTVYTSAQILIYQKALKSLQNKSNKQLAEMLQANNQTKTGAKDTLIEKIADGLTLGQIPRCPHCFGGRLRFNIKTGEYSWFYYKYFFYQISSPGYQDDDKFRFCNKKFSFSEITRSPWVTNSS